jgi:ribosomal protein S18 acetylase RimI-like enzyme
LNLFMIFIFCMVYNVKELMLELSSRDLTDKSVIGIAFSSFLFIAFAEEISKYAALRYYSFNRISFDEPLDGIVYSVMVGMGFATLENIGYAIKYGMPTIWLRIFTAVPAHATFGIIMGYYIGKAKFDFLNRKKLLFKGVIAATLAHGFYDFFLYLNQNTWIHRYISATVAELLFFIGSITSLAISLIFSLRLVRLHRFTSTKLNLLKPVLTIRHASKEDIELIRTLSLQIWPQTYAAILSPPQIRYMMLQIYSEQSLKQQMESRQQFIIVYNAGVPIGFASYGEVEPTIYKLHKIYLLNKQQGRGSGRFVVQQVISEIQPKGATALRLNVNRYNPAKGFYEKLGFEEIGVEDIDIGNGYFMNDFVMEKKLIKEEVVAGQPM